MGPYGDFFFPLYLDRCQMVACFARIRQIALPLAVEAIDKPLRLKQKSELQCQKTKIIAYYS